MLEEEKTTSQEVERRLLSTLQNWVETVFFTMLIEKMGKGGIKEGSLTARVFHANLLQYKRWSSFTIQSPTTSSVAYIYYAEAILSSSWVLTAPSGIILRTIHFRVKAEVCLTNWEGVLDFRVEDIVVEGSDFHCSHLNSVVHHRVSHHEVSKQGKEALSLIEFDEDAVQQIANFLLLHFLPPIYNFLSKKAAEIENALIRILTTLPPLSVEFRSGVYLYKVKEVNRRAIKTYGSKVSTTGNAERWEDELMVVVEGVWEGDGDVKEMWIRVAVFVTLMEWRSKDGRVNVVGKMKMGVDREWGREFLSPPGVVVKLHNVLEMRVENSKEGVEQFFAKVIGAINEEEIRKLIGG